MQYTSTKREVCLHHAWRAHDQATKNIVSRNHKKVTWFLRVKIIFCTHHTIKYKMNYTYTMGKYTLSKTEQSGQSVLDRFALSLPIHDNNNEDLNILFSPNVERISNKHIICVWLFIILISWFGLQTLNTELQESWISKFNLSLKIDFKFYMLYFLVC